jgi:hypothetical protein
MNNPRTNLQCRVWNFATKRSEALGSLKHKSFDINDLYQFTTPYSTLNATQLTMPATKHVQKTPFSQPIYSTLIFTHVTDPETEYDRRNHSDTLTE